MERARSLGFSDDAIEALKTRIRSVKVGEIPTGGWSDAEQILIGRTGLITPTREGRIFHELGHVLDDIRSPGLFERSAQPGFGLKGYHEAERVAYAMQYGEGSIRGAVLAPYAALHSAYPTATKIVTIGESIIVISASGYVIYKKRSE